MLLPFVQAWLWREPKGTLADWLTGSELLPRFPWCCPHANSAREAVTKLCTLPLLAGDNVTHKFVVPTVAGCIDLVVHISTEAGARRAVREVLAIPGRVEGDVVEASELFVTRDEKLVRGDGWPPHVERFGRAGFDLTDLLALAQTVLR